MAVEGRKSSAACFPRAKQRLIRHKEPLVLESEGQESAGKVQLRWDVHSFETPQMAPLNLTPSAFPMGLSGHLISLPAQPVL